MSQTLKPDEVIVIDDGSDDETRQLVSQHFPEVVYYYQANLGVSAARNKGIELAKGSWIAFLDSDDQWLDNKLERQAGAWSKAKDHRIVHSDEIWIRNDIPVTKPARYQVRQGRIYEHCLKLCAMAPSSVVIEKSLLIEVGCFDAGLPACEDYDLWLKVCANYPVLACPEALLIRYGGHADQLSTTTWGLDQYRVQGLYNMVHSSQFTEALTISEQKKTLSVLQKKLEILIKGASRRGNQALQESAQAMLNTMSISKRRYV
jgi:glycosyltransferase involved in cell wall biosynthesis